MSDDTQDKSTAKDHLSQAEWHERRQKAQLGDFGTYGGAQDQFSAGVDPELPEQQPRVPVQHQRPGSVAASSPEPYRAQRVDGGHEDVEAAAAGTASEMSGHYDEVDGRTRGAAPMPDVTGAEDALVRSLHDKVQAAFGSLGLGVGRSGECVTIYGSVPDVGTKAAVERIVRDGAGKVGIENRINVRGSQARSLQGEGLAAATDESTVLNGRQV